MKANAVRDMEQAIDNTFFQDLQQEIEAPTEDREQVRAGWMTRKDTGIIDRARRTLQDHMESAPCPSGRRLRGRANAESMLENWLRTNRGFPQLYERSEEKE